ncbi:MAG: peptidoglycan DD-metalloendopeptidase family protein [Cyclobacteriaceae bacterium]|jgi:murein DD-endopeptidase MepM/ murein hydrolase activator NlpD|nr:peptidoglycan DD-metalloendopeptidase family protein [Cyclobacteriaceae bacterium]
MGKSKYYYDPETCQYQRVRIGFGAIAGYAAGVLSVASLMFAGLTLLADRLVMTERERHLLLENEALSTHRVVLTKRLAGIEAEIDNLHEKDLQMHEKLFEVTPRVPERSAARRNNAILSANAREFTDELEALKEKTEHLINASTRVNRAFGQRFSGVATDRERLGNMPTLQPIVNSNLDFVVSGFGTRINPFHKGKYKHPGIDFAAPRGTVVVATAPGRVTLVRESRLQAGYGTYVEISHGGGLVTRYAHLHEVKVKQGEKVAKGQPIATVGNTGGSIAPHLHYEIIRDGQHVDPLGYMVEGLSSRDYNRLAAACRVQNQSLD